MLTGTENPRRYWSDLKRKMKTEGAVEVYEKMVQLKMTAPDGKKRLTDVADTEQPQGFAASQQIARRGGRVAGIARQTLEAETGKPVITSQNAADFRQLVTNIVEDAAALPEQRKRAADKKDK